MQITPAYVSDQNPQCRANYGRIIYLHPCRLYEVLKWSLSVCLCARAHEWKGSLVMPLPFSEAFNGHPEQKLQVECLQEGSPAMEGIWKLLCLTGLSKHFFNVLYYFLSSSPLPPPPPFCLIFHVGMEEEKDLLWINEDCFHLLRGAPFAFLRFWVGSQELQSTIEPASNVKWLLHSLWMMWAHRVPVPLMSVPVGSVK